MVAPNSRDLTLEEALGRVPSESEYLTTDQFRHAVGDVHEVTVYRWIAAKVIKAYRVRSRGKAYTFKREDVVKFIRNRFSPSLVEPEGQDEVSTVNKGNNDRSKSVRASGEARNLSKAAKPPRRGKN